MKVGAISFDLGVYGSVRRWMEIGNEMVRRGIDYTLYTRKPNPCTWFDFKGKIKRWTDIREDYFINGDPRTFNMLPTIKCKYIFIYVVVGGSHINEYNSVYGKYTFILNNRKFKELWPNSHVVEGGVNTKHFTLKPRRVLFQDRTEPFKNTKYIREQLSGVPGIELVGLKNLSNEEMAKACKTGDYLVVWESRGGWANVAAEAIASGLTVVTNGVNCEPFLDKVIVVENLREFFVDPMGQFSYKSVVDQLLDIFHAHKHKSTTPP